MEYILKEVLFPRRCPVCDKIVVPWGNLCCDRCQGRLEYIGAHYCMKCGKGLSKEEREFCRDCESRRHYFYRGRSLYRYESVAGALFRLKYQGRQEYANFFAEELYRHLGSDIRAMKADVMLPVPLHKSRFRTRGYNQAAVIGRALALRMQIPFCEDMAVRCKNTIPQKQLSLSERQNNLKKAFKLSGNDVKSDTVIIVDDIYTTGSTVDALSEVLMEGGTKRVYVITLAAGME